MYLLFYFGYCFIAMKRHHNSGKRVDRREWRRGRERENTEERDWSGPGVGFCTSSVILFPTKLHLPVFPKQYTS